ncbi:hypothetical protein [Haloplasma contractile]|uniref:Uncharacterized protein n=1 Tax=Haloplasma contractile SSD-17B TaxID=1033810 RepID=U2EEZ3_9MOLU|nr:hypothetical protein [Haloplasma contractile]ERJ13503.1 hypothetical protein HLPCO_000154 [Haloplasma contractile SSD-17B]
MILFAVVLGCLLSYFILTMNTNPSRLKEFLFGKNEYQVYDIIDTKNIKQNKKAK